MELLLALAVVIVASASLLIANVFNRRFNSYGQRLAETKENVADSRTEQRKKTEQITAELRAITQTSQRLEQTMHELSERQGRDSQALVGEDKKTRESTADIASRVSKLSELVTRTFSDHASRLDSLIQSTAQLRAHGDLTAHTARLEAEVMHQGAALKELRDDFASENERMTQALTGIRQQLLASAREIDLLGVDHADMRSGLRMWLDHTARLTSADLSTLIMPGFIAAEGRAALEILPCLYEALLRSAGLDPVFRADAGSAGVAYYLAWNSSNGPSLEQYLGSLLTAYQDDGVSLVGLTQFRSLLLAMHVGRPATVRLGPLIIGHTPEGMFRGIVMTAEEATALDEDGPGFSPTAWVERLKAVGGERAVDLTAWAADA